jgi:tetratricopeptide (TPR) repeat protein
MDSSSLWWRGEHEQYVEIGHFELPIFATYKNFPHQVMTYFLIGQAYHALGDYAQAVDFLRRNVTLLEGDLVREDFDLPGLASVLSRTWLVWSLAEQGKFSEGLTYGEEAVQIAETTDHRYSLIVASLGLGVLHVQKGEVEGAIAVLERGVALSQAERLPQLFPLVAAPLGAAYALVGRVAEAVSVLEEVVKQAAVQNFMGTHARRLTWLGEGYLPAGRSDEAMSHVMHAIDLARVHKERGHEAWGLRLLGEVYARQPLPALEPAEVAYRQALALAAELGMAPLQAHCHLGLGLLYARSGRPQQAHAHLSTAIDLFRAMEMGRWLPEAEAALAQVLA